MKHSLNKKILLSLFCMSLFSGLAYSQLTNDYTPLVSSGRIPEEFLKTARSMSEEEVKTVTPGKDKYAKQQFIISNNYFIRDLLLSGDVLVNDPLTKYVNRVADELLKGQPALRSQLHIYVTKSSDVNAYAFDKGYIFVNVGLLAQLENEAQLAFVLAHEITHVVKKHSVNQYIEEIRLDNGTSTYERGGEESRSLAKYRFSKEQESEADMEGLALMKQTGYSIKALNGAFDVLQYSYLPFELLDFKKSFFEDKNLILPDTLYLKTVSEVKSNDDYDDTKSTHPNIRKRRGAIEPDLKVSDESSRKKYLVSEDEFKNMRETARFEVCHLYLVERDYVNAIYASYIQLQKYPDNLFLKKTISQSLYNILVNKSTHKKDSDHGGAYTFDDNISSSRYNIPDYNKIEGASQRVYYMLDNLSSEELNTIALSYTFKAHKQFPSDKVLSSLTDSLFSEMVNANSLFLNDFSRKSKSELKQIDTAKAPVVETEQEESKYSQIKKQQQKVEVATDDNFVKYAFVDLLKDDEFVSRYSKMAKGLTHKPLTGDDYTSSSKSKKKKKKRTDAPFLGIDKVAFISPFYMKVKNDHGTEYVNFYESEEKQQTLSDIQEKCADRLKMEFAHVSIKDLSANDMKKYNDNALINEWLSERFKHGDNNDELVTSSEYTERLINELGTKYVAWSGVYNRKGKVARNTYFFILLDIESGKLMKYETRYTRAKDNKDMITSFVYNSLMHVHKKPKE